MKPFRFGLEKLLGLRKYYEDEAKIELGKAVGILAGIESNIRAVAGERAKAAAAQFSPENSAAEIQQYMFYLLRLDEAKERLLREAALAEEEVETAREAFIEASRERKVLENLKDKRRGEYKKEALAEEAKALDDIGKISRA